MNRFILHFCFGLILVLFTLRVFSQSPFYAKCGNPVDFPKGDFSNLMDYDDLFYYFLRLNERSQLAFNANEPPAIEVYDRQLNHVKSIPLILKVDQKLKKVDPVAFFKVDSGFVFLMQTYSTISQVMRSYLYKTNQNGVLTGELLIPGEVNDVTPNLADFQFFQLNRISRNGKLLFVFGMKTPAEMEVAERVNLAVYDENLKKEGDRLINFPEDFFNYKFSNLVFGNSGMVFFRVEITNPFLMDKTVHQLVVYDLFAETNQSLEFKFAEGEIACADLARVDEKTICYYGYFTQNEEDKQIRGVFYYFFNLEDGTLMRHNIFTLPENVASLFDPKNLYSKSEYQHLIPAGIQISASKTVFLILEYNWRSLMLIRDQEGKVYNQPVYNANEVFVLEFDKNDRLINQLNIPKEQSNGFDKSGLGVFSFVYNNSLFILYNDHPKNLQQYDASKLKTMKMDYQGVMAECTFSENGYQKYQIMTSGIPVKLESSDIIRISETALLFLEKSRKTPVEVLFH